ncbi:MAG: hypothetical protein KJ065_16460 [Anaerolineae bacterium]|nr:hypothetical protein [Anaerolineae bacterium]
MLQHGPLTLGQLQVGCQTLAFGPEAANFAIFDGYLFDQPARTAELDRSGGVLTEVEIVALAYERWGEDLFNHLDGGYLAAVWDAQRGRLIAGHDVFSRHPFFYGQIGRRLFFAPTVNALLESGAFPRIPNRLNLALRVGGFFTLQDDTFFESIHRLRHAHYLAADVDGRCTIHEYWNPLPKDGEPYLPDEQVLEKFEPLLRQAVARCFAVGMDGILLSGGLDSSAIAGIAHQIGQVQGHAPLAAFAFTRTTDEPVSYEQRNQRAIADRLRLPYRASSFLDYLDDRDLVTISIEDTAHSAEPNTSWWAGLYPHFLRSMADAGCTSIFSGAGGDEWLDVDSSYFPDVLRSLSLPKLTLFLGSMRQEGKWRQRSLAQRLSLFARQMMGAYWARCLPNLRRAYRIRRLGGQLPGWLCADPALRQTLQRVLNDEIQRPELDARGRVPASYYEHGKSYLWRFLAESSVCETDFLYAHSAGLRILMPFFDRDLVAMLAQASPWVLLNEGRSKSLNRMVVRRVLPESGVEAQVKDYAPEELRPYFQQIQKYVVSAAEKVGTSRLAGYGIINSDRLSITEKASQGITRDQVAYLYAVVSAETWLKNQLAGE